MRRRHVQLFRGPADSRPLRPIVADAINWPTMFVLLEIGCRLEIRKGAAPRVSREDDPRLQIRCIRTCALRCLRPAWESLPLWIPHAQSQHWEWLAPWWHAYGTDRELMCWRFFEALPGLVGLAPLSITTKRSASSVRIASSGSSAMEARFG